MAHFVPVCCFALCFCLLPAGAARQGTTRNESEEEMVTPMCPT